MRLSRRLRFATALFALLSVLCMQLAVAAYACPSLQSLGRNAAEAASPQTAVHEGMTGCEGVVDSEQPALCYVHSQIGDQSLDKPAPPDVSPAVAVMLVPAIQDAAKAHAPPSRYVDAAGLMREAFPALTIRNCCFRI